MIHVAANVDDNVISELCYASGTTPTNYTFTGQYSNMTDFGLMFYNARWPRSVPETQWRGYDPALGRFAQADSLVPPGVQGYDRYAYVNNDPVRYTDSTGHMAWNGEGGCSGVMDCKYLAYTAAGIKVQSQWKDIIIWDEYSGRGPAQVSNKQMAAPFGEEVTDEKENKRGVGLGLDNWSCKISKCESDQMDPVVAQHAMETRILASLKVCINHGCSETDNFIVAALAENGSMSPNEVRTALNQYQTAAGSTVIDWKNWIASDAKNQNYRLGLIIDFSTNMFGLEKQGYVVPSVDWGYMASLMVNP